MKSSPKPFVNESFLDFSKPDVASRQQAALEAVREQFGKEYPNIINGKKVRSTDKTISVNPAQPSEVVGIFQKSGKDDAGKALKAALKAFEVWKDVPYTKRAGVLFKAAGIMRKRRLEINAWMISEVGKNFAEADADTAEAIDFLEFYGREALRYGAPQPIVPAKGEDNQMYYVPLGVGVVIPPWNFPFAILAGMCSAAIVTGNTVIVKPSSDSPMMGWLYMSIMTEAGLPDGVLNFLVASGAEAGDYLVGHPKTRFVSFTGSMEVGLHINQLAATPQKDQIWIKRVVAEMGGKDAIVVDKDANVDEAVAGVVAAAFSFQGQKCSACSRAIVDAHIYDEFVTKLKISVDALQDKIGDPATNALVGPVVSARAEKTILNYINVGKKEGKLISGGGKAKGHDGYFIEPTVFVNVKPNARLMQEEIFGPVLAVCKAKNFDHALEIANNTIYGLTGAVYTKSEKKLKRAQAEFHCGNLYLNRKCTGALVGAHPFGGFNMSGTDSKAGGRDYLLLFLQAKTVSRKI
ncbi:MAG: L-glutamate gamma-semialdehyde dehydrogenase [bacterium]|nr:L-glutamate gamma-semialdehyde dehydrogenase [bacterium]